MRPAAAHGVSQPLWTCWPPPSSTIVAKRVGRREVREPVAPLTVDGQLGRARYTDEWDRLIGALDAFEPVDTTAAHLNRALQVRRLLAARSQRGRKIPDLLVAAAAEELGIGVLHYDPDFDLIASVTGQRCRWVVPAGSIE